MKIDQDKGGSRKSCLWQFNPEKLEKVEQELLKYDERDVKRALRNAGVFLFKIFFCKPYLPFLF